MSKSTVRCADGPYAGQTFTVDIPFPVEFEKKPWRGDFVAGPLCWVVNGANCHGYQLRAHNVTRRTFPDSFHLVYVGTVQADGTVTAAAEYGGEPYERLPEAHRVTVTVP